MDKNYSEITKLYSELGKTKFKMDSFLTEWTFSSWLQNENISQIIMVVRATNDGIVFTDRLISFEEIDLLLRKMKKDKELLYIISNKASLLQEFFAKTGKFNCVICSEYTEGDDVGFLLTLKFLQEFYPRNIKLENDNDPNRFEGQEFSIDNYSIKYPVQFKSEFVPQEKSDELNSFYEIINFFYDKFFEVLKHNSSFPATFLFLKPSPNFPALSPGFFQFQKALPVFKVQNQIYRNSWRINSGELIENNRKLA